MTVNLTTLQKYISGYFNCSKRADHILEMAGLWAFFVIIVSSIINVN